MFLLRDVLAQCEASAERVMLPKYALENPPNSFAKAGLCSRQKRTILGKEPDL